MYKKRLIIFALLSAMVQGAWHRALTNVSSKKYNCLKIW